MLENYDPRKGDLLQILDKSGKIVKGTSKLPTLKDQELLEAFKYMVQTRVADDWSVSLNRQGRLPTYPPNRGQEANPVGALLALRKDDWFVQAFREIGGMLVRGIPLSQQFLYWLGNEEGSRFPLEEFHTTPISVPIASQALHATGIAYAEQYRGTDRVAIAFVGDGGTSEGEFYEAMNFAGVWKAPVIFYIQNNQWAISTPRKNQTAANTIAEKAFSCGFHGIQVDGNDIQAVYAAVTLAAKKARAGDGPTLIEGITYRMGAHTTADDPTRYRKDEEVTEWVEKDPLLRVEKYLKQKKLLTDKSYQEMQDNALKTAKEAFETAENYPVPTIEDGFRYMYHEMPDHLKIQLENRILAEGGNKS